MKDTKTSTMEEQKIHLRKEAEDANILLEKKQTISSSGTKDAEISFKDIETLLGQKQILSSSSTEQAEDISDKTETFLKDEQTVSPSSISLHDKTYCRTWFESTTFEYVWIIDRFASLFKVVDVLTSAPMLETVSYKIQMTVFHEVEYVIKFYILTEKAFTGLCNISITSSNKTILTTSISGYITNKTLLCETTLNSWPIHYNNVDILRVYCNFEIFHQFLNDTMHIGLQPLPTIYSSDLKSENSNLNDDSKFDDKKLTFIINKEPYSISTKRLCATNSKYFKSLCNKNKGPIEVTVNDRAETFQEMLSYIRTGLVPQLTNNYKFQSLLIIADKYDVQDLKLICEHRLLRCITIHTAVKLLAFAISYRAKYLQEHAAMFIKLHFKEIIKAKGFDILPKKCSDIIIRYIKKYKISQQSAALSLSSRLIKQQFLPNNP